jgi:phosphohistidine phosphatase
MEIYILRHGIAVERGSPGYKKDSDRPLTEDGEDKMHRIAQAMVGTGMRFDLILSSPYVRAEQTAHIVAAEMDEEVALTDSLIPGGNILELIKEVNERKPGSVLLVGHEPDLSRLVSLLVTGGNDASIELKKGGLCRLAADKLTFGRCATLNWLLTPKQLRSLR